MTAVAHRARRPLPCPPAASDSRGAVYVSASASRPSRGFRAALMIGVVSGLAGLVVWVDLGPVALWAATHAWVFPLVAVPSLGAWWCRAATGWDRIDARFTKGVDVLHRSGRRGRVTGPGDLDQVYVKWRDTWETSQVPCTELEIDDEFDRQGDQTQ